MESTRTDDQLSSLDLVADTEEQANTLVGLLNRLVVQCQDERTVSNLGYCIGYTSTLCRLKIF